MPLSGPAGVFIVGPVDPYLHSLKSHKFTLAVLFHLEAVFLTASVCDVKADSDVQPGKPLPLRSPPVYLPSAHNCCSRVVHSSAVVSSPDVAVAHCLTPDPGRHLSLPGPNVCYCFASDVSTCLPLSHQSSVASAFF